jgi:hypothetical protein
MPLATGPSAYRLVRTVQSGASKADDTAATTILALLAGMNSCRGLRP